ncbi:MAG: type IV toxin-antitoxin system AbiEi family antitoxin domain-containing protein [Steroidobacteraceae bacterium]
MASIVHPSRGRRRLAQVASRARPFVDVSMAAHALQLDPKRAAKQLARWHEQGLLRRIRRGLYAVVPAAAALREKPVDDPWLLVPRLFREGYIAGWSAAEHWDLTEQLFTTLLVCTPDPVKHARVRIAGLDIRARHIPRTLWFGTAAIWRDGTKVLVSDLHKTFVDMCHDPALGGGIQHVALCVAAYLRRGDADPTRLIEYLEQAKSAPAFKRLGFLCEVLQGPRALSEACLRGVTVGLAKLDPAMASPRVSKRWQLRLPHAWERILANG